MSKLKTVKINTGTKQTAFSYQNEAFRQVRDLEYAAIFHEQGLGKTKIAIDLILYWLENNYVDTVLVVAKKGLLHNWLREFKFHTYINPTMLTQSHKVNFHVFNSPAKVILTHYEVFKTEHERLKLFLKTRDVGVILDESTKIKNPNSDLTESFLNLSGFFKKKMIMTGTPVANRPQDIWSQIKFLDQGESLGEDYEAFKRSVDFKPELSDDHEEQSAFENNLSTTFDKISSFSVRETKDGGIIELPEKKSTISIVIGKIINIHYINSIEMNLEQEFFKTADPLKTPPKIF